MSQNFKHAARLSDTRKKSILDRFFLTVPYGKYEKSVNVGFKYLNGSIKLHESIMLDSHADLSWLGIARILNTSGLLSTGAAETVVFQSPPMITA